MRGTEEKDQGTFASKSGNKVQVRNFIQSKNSFSKLGDNFEKKKFKKVQKKNQKLEVIKESGVTLIALIISIIIIIILAGVSINAIVGDNGIITRATNAAFLAEMSEVKEAYQIWKVGKEDSDIPTSGMVSSSDVSVGRLVGEIGYYRTWYLTDSQPSTDITIDEDTFNSTFEAELVYYPAGVQDLYYLDTEALGLSTNATFLIDISTGLIYMIGGTTVNGVSCYSVEMYNQLMGGTYTPTFAETDISITGNAGNVQSEYNEDGTENEDYDPYGFEIISQEYSDNVYKLYNNGDLYAKGIKSLGIDTSSEELESISSYNWSEFTVPSEIGDYKKIIQGYNTIFVIDSDNHVWAWGDNTSNKLGLSEEQMKEFTGREPIQLSVTDSSGDELEIQNVYDTYDSTFLVTTSNEVYSCGGNKCGCLGVESDDDSITSFKKCVGLPSNVEISKLFDVCYYGATGNTIILYENGSIYMSGYMLDGTEENCFVEILSGAEYKVVDCCPGERVTYNEARSASSLIILLEDGLVYELDGNLTLNKIDGIDSVVSITLITSGCWLAFEKIDGEFYFYNVDDSSSNYQYLYLSDSTQFKGTNGYVSLISLSSELPEEMFLNGNKIQSIKTVFFDTVTSVILYIMSDGSLWGSGYVAYLGIGSESLTEYSSGTTEAILLIDSDGSEGFSNLNGIEINYDDGDIVESSSYNVGYCLIYNDEKIYITGNQSIQYGNSILQLSWTKIASNVDSVFIGGGNNSIAIITQDGNAYIILENYGDIGEESVSSSVEYGNNFRKITDENLDGKVAEVHFSYGAVFILTTDNQLYTAGRGKFDTTWVGNAYSGLGTEVLTKQTLLASDVEMITSVSTGSVESGNFYISDGNLYFWGVGMYNGTGISSSNTPKQITVSGDEDFDASNILKIYANWTGVYFFMNDGSLYAGGTYYSLGINNASTVKLISKIEFSDIDFNGENVVDIKFIMHGQSVYLLTDQGNVYAWGPKIYLGLGENSTDWISPQKLDITDVSSITTTASGVIVTKNDGTVWATGYNTYGVFGRWIGVGRGTSNSRYKTALNWVECPELEL